MTPHNEVGPGTGTRPDSPNKISTHHSPIRRRAEGSALGGLSGMDGHPIRERLAGLSDTALRVLLDRADPPLRRALRDLVPTPRPVEDARTTVALVRIEHRRRTARRDAEVLDRLLGELVGGEIR